MMEGARRRTDTRVFDQRARKRTHVRAISRALGVEHVDGRGKAVVGEPPELEILARGDSSRQQ
jgi:hypothetical protein